MAAHSKDKSETSASHPRRETRTRTATEKPSRAMDEAPSKHDSDELSAEQGAQPQEASDHPPTDAHEGVDRLHEATAYLRDHDIDDVLRDAVAVVRHNPLLTALVFGGVILVRGRHRREFAAGRK